MRLQETLSLLFRCSCLSGLAIALTQAAPPAIQKTFATPEEAIQATIEAADRNDTSALLGIFGPAGKDIVNSGDPAQDTTNRGEFAASAHEKLELEKNLSNPDRVVFTVGVDGWPFPVPVTRKDGKWRLDSKLGRFEILARRIGGNELEAMEVCRGFAEAQLEYAAEPRDGDKILKYAQRVFSTPGKQDGLYSDGSTSNLVPKAFADAVSLSPAARAQKPFHGYYFRMLKAQGPDTPGGAFDYLVNGKMIGGFALVAWPAEYGVSGIKTLIISHSGVVYEKDLGQTTQILSRQLVKFNPDKTWREVVLE